MRPAPVPPPVEVLGLRLGDLLLGVGAVMGLLGGWVARVVIRSAWLRYELLRAMWAERAKEQGMVGEC